MIKEILVGFMFLITMGLGLIVIFTLIHEIDKYMLKRFKIKNFVLMFFVVIGWILFFCFILYYLGWFIINENTLVQNITR